MAQIFSVSGLQSKGGVREAAAVSAAYFVLLLLFLAIAPIGSSSEAREAHVIQAISTTGEWLLPSRNGLVPSKPPLFHWCAALAVRVIGISPMHAARLVSALSAALLVFFTMRLAARLFPKAPQHVAFLSAAILITNYEFVRLSLDCRVDMFFSLLVFISIGFVLEQTAAMKTSLVVRAEAAACGFWLASGLAVLSKGPLGAVLPVLAASLLLFRTGGLRIVSRFFLKGAMWILPFLLLAFPWYLYAASQGNHGLLSRQLLFENLLRFFGGEFVNERPFYYYIINGLRASFPWFPLFLLTIPSGIGSLRKTGADARGDLFAVFILALLFFSLATGKRYSYLAPVFPVMSIYLAMVMSDWHEALGGMERARIDGALERLSSLVAPCLAVLILAGGGSMLPIVFKQPFAAYARSWISAHVNFVVLPASLLLGLALSGLKFSGYRRILQLVSLEFVLLTLVYLGVGLRNSLTRFEENAAGIREKVGAAALLTAVRDLHNEYLDPILYHLDRRVRIAKPGDPLDCRGFFMARRDCLQGLTQPVSISGEYRQLTDLWAEAPRDRDVMLFECAGD